MVYFGNYNILQSTNVPQDYVDSYNYIFKVNTLDANQLEIVDIMYINKHYEYLNIDNLHSHFNEYEIKIGMIIHLEENTDIYLTYPSKNSNKMKLYSNFNDSNYIYLDSLDKIKENMIKANKILSS